MSIVMGIDAGLTSPGVAVVRCGSVAAYGDIVMAECFRPSVDRQRLSTSMFDAARCAQIVRYIAGLIRLHQPDVIVIELPTGGARSAAAIKGMAMSTAMTSALVALVRPTATAVVVITPLQNKKGSTGEKARSMSKADSEQSKWNVLAAVNQAWPGLGWPRKKRKPAELDDAVCWAMADALSCVLTYLKMSSAERSKASLATDLFKSDDVSGALGLGPPALAAQPPAPATAPG